MSETRLPEALALLRERGWRQGHYGSRNGPYCIVGAVCRVVVENRDDYDCREDMEAIDAIVFAHHRCAVVPFNDDPATTFADVEFVLEKAILARGGAL